MLIDIKKYYLDYKQALYNSINDYIRTTNYLEIVVSLTNYFGRISAKFNNELQYTIVDLGNQQSILGIETYFKKLYSGCDIIITSLLEEWYESTKFTESTTVDEWSCKFTETPKYYISSLKFTEDSSNYNVSVSFAGSWYTPKSDSYKEMILSELYRKMPPNSRIYITIH